MARPPVALSGVSIGTTTGWPGVSTTSVGDLAHRAPVDVAGAGVDELALPQLTGDQRDAAGVEEVGRDELSARLQAGHDRRAGGDRVELVDRERDVRARGRSRAGAGRRWSSRRAAATDAAAFSIASRVMMCEGRTSSRTSCIASRPHSSAASPLPRLSAGIPFRPAGLMPRKSSAIDMVLAVNWPPQAPAPGHAADSTSCSSAASILPAA